MVSRSLVTYARTTLIATRRPSYIPCDTSAKPPHSTSTESSEQSGMCMVVGITRCRLHVLQSLLSNFRRSRSDTMLFSRRSRLCQPSVSALGECGRAHLIHFIDTLLDFRLRIPQKLEERGNPWEEFPTLPPLAGSVKHVVHSGEFTSLVWFTTPASRDYIPNGVFQQSTLT